MELLCVAVRVAALGPVQQDQQAKYQRRRVAVQRVLRLEGFRYLRARLGTEDLLARNPAVVVDQRGPRFHQLHRERWIPSVNVQQVEALVPVKATREGCARGRRRQQATRRRRLRNHDVVVVQHEVVGVRRTPVHEARAVIVPDATQELRRDLARVLALPRRVLGQVKRVAEARFIRRAVRLERGAQRGTVQPRAARRLLRIKEHVVRKVARVRALQGVEHRTRVGVIRQLQHLGCRRQLVHRRGALGQLSELMVQLRDKELGAAPEARRLCTHCRKCLSRRVSHGPIVGVRLGAQGKRAYVRVRAMHARGVGDERRVALLRAEVEERAQRSRMRAVKHRAAHTNGPVSGRVGRVPRLDKRRLDLVVECAVDNLLLAKRAPIMIRPRERIDTIHVRSLVPPHAVMLVARNAEPRQTSQHGVGHARPHPKEELRPVGAPQRREVFVHGLSG